MSSSKQYILAFLIAVCFVAELHSNEICSIEKSAQSKNRLGVLDMQNGAGCLGYEVDDNALTKSVRKELANIIEDAKTEEELAVRRDQLLDLLVKIKGSLTNSSGEMNSTWQSYANIALNELEIAENELRAFENIVRAQYWSRSPEHGFFEQPATGVFLISYGSVVDGACSSNGFSDECKSTIESINTLTRHINLVYQVLQNPVRERLQGLHAELVKLGAEWAYYFEDARSQFWWEFIANNAIYDPPGNTLARPPAGQLILLHPSVAMEYVGGGATVDKSYNLVGIIELIGYNRLRWGEDKPYSKWPLGISIVATYVPAAQGDEFGYGLTLHVKNNYSFGATRRDTGMGHDTTFIFSVDLNKLFLEKSAEAKNLFETKSLSGTR